MKVRLLLGIAVALVSLSAPAYGQTLYPFD